ncbi:hypothetical protein CO660_19135 [Rhizobium sp. L9]|nr:hypothetical protein CO660_19135 [Rhizobium sp. L9]
MNTADPKMAAIAAYATAYAQYELANGVAPPADDPVLGDAALTTALASATKTGTLSPEALAWAKDTLGIDTAIGTIDQMRDALAAAAPVAEEPMEETPTTETPATETPTGETAEGSETTDPSATAETPEAEMGSTEEVSGTTESAPAADSTETSATATSTEATGL